MTERDVLMVGRDTLLTALKMALPILMSALVAGVLVSLFQAVTQIQEFTLAFVPKLLAVVLALALFGPWMIATMIQFFNYTYNHMTPIIR